MYDLAMDFDLNAVGDLVGVDLACVEGSCMRGCMGWLHGTVL